jgi:hypothetical protein
MVGVEGEIIRMGVVQWRDLNQLTLARAWAMAAGLLPMVVLGGGIKGAIAPHPTAAFRKSRRKAG